MRRALNIFFWIFLGAFAACVGMGFVLFQEHLDKKALFCQIQTNKEQLQSIQTTHDRLIQEAEKKLTEAKAEVKRIQELSDRREQEQAFLKTAPALYAPPSRVLRSWSSVISVPLGISLRLPPQAQASSTDGRITASTNDEQWLIVVPYKEEIEQANAKVLSNTKAIQYKIGDRLLQGVQGERDGISGTTFLLRVQSQGVPTFLLWARTTSHVNQSLLLQTLGTLTFAS
jgi:hypothetical protein